MDQEAAKLALQFMERAQLTGNEVPAFCKAQAWLMQVAASEPTEAKKGK